MGSEPKLLFEVTVINHSWKVKEEFIVIYSCSRCLTAGWLFFKEIRLYINTIWFPIVFSTILVESSASVDLLWQDIWKGVRLPTCVKGP